MFTAPWIAHGCKRSRGKSFHATFTCPSRMYWSTFFWKAFCSNLLENRHSMSSYMYIVTGASLLPSTGSPSRDTSDVFACSVSSSSGATASEPLVLLGGTEGWLPALYLRWLDVQAILRPDIGDRSSAYSENRTREQGDSHRRFYVVLRIWNIKFKYRRFRFPPAPSLPCPRASGTCEQPYLCAYRNPNRRQDTR